MVCRKERPKCREAIEKILAEKGCTLEELLREPHRLSDGLKVQARKMLEEQRQKEKGL